MPFRVRHSFPASIVAFGNLANKSCNTSIFEFAKIARPDNVWASVDDVLREVVPDKVDFNWLAPQVPGRTEKYRLNAWLQFAPVLYAARAHDTDPAFSMLLKQFTGRWMAHWIAQYRFTPSDPTGGQLQNKLAWFDMAVGLRAALLSQILNIDAGKLFNKEELAWLKRGVKEHVQALKLPETWAAHSNHGFFQSAGLFALATQAGRYVPHARKMRILAADRILHYLDSSLSEDGVHLEHSPEYHGFMFSALCELYPLLDKARLVEEKIGSHFEGMQNAFEAMILPNHLIAAFGDGRYTRASSAMPRGEKVRDMLQPALRNTLAAADSGGDYGRFCIFKEGGFASYKRKSESRTSYLGVSSWHHSAVHKQVDDHSFIWSEDGAVILSDAGRYGYEGKTSDASELRARGFFYSAKERIFVESAQAHTTVEIDGQSDNRRNAIDYQSGLVTHGVVNEGVHLVELDIVREPLVRHKRILLYLPGSFLLVVDDMERLLDDVHEEGLQKFTSWHQYFPSWSVTLEDGQTSATFNPSWRDEYFGTGEETATARKLYEAMTPNRDYKVSSRTVIWTKEAGQQDAASKVYHGDKDGDDRYMGWASLWPKTLEPSAAVGHDYVGRSREVSFATLFQVLPKGGLAQAAPTIRFDSEKGKKHISWTEAGIEKSVKFERAADILRVSFNESEPVVLNRSMVEKNQQAQAFYQARAARRNQHTPDQVLAYYDLAVAGGGFQAAKEASDYALSVGDEALGVKLLKQASENGSGQAMIDLAKLYMNTVMSSEGAKEVEGLLTRAVQKNFRSAYYYLGILYLKKESSLYNLKKATRAFQAGLNRGHDPCRKKLIEVSIENGEHFRAVSDMQDMWARGDQSVGKLLLSYYSDKENVHGFKDLGKALSIHTYLAEAGSTVSAYEAGCLAMQADQEFYDLDLARRMFGLAVERGSAISAYNLAGLLDKGELNYRSKMRKLLEMAADGNIRDAQARLVELSQS